MRRVVGTGQNDLNQGVFRRFLSVYKCPETEAPPNPEEMARMGKLIEEGMKAGYFLAVEGCMPSRGGARVRLERGKVSVCYRAGREQPSKLHDDLAALMAAYHPRPFPAS